MSHLSARAMDVDFRWGRVTIPSQRGLIFPLRQARCTGELVSLFLGTIHEAVIFSVKVLVLKSGCSLKIGINAAKMLTISGFRIYREGGTHANLPVLYQQRHAEP